MMTINQMEYNPDQIRQAAEDAAYQKEANRLDPRFAREGDAMELKLRNQGLRAGDQAYDSAMSTFDTGKNDAYEQARLGATQTGMGEANQLWNQQMQGTNMSNALRDQQIAEYLQKRGFSLGEMNALDTTENMNELAGVYAGGSE